ncbi:hypothetical protein J4E80_009455 [Alternaria sp. BMP 0032]|nr:hypothetical protein J4E80_009455 [Alternaria sp. BMP 0032]
MANISVLLKDSAEYESFSRQAEAAINDDRNVTLDNGSIDRAYEWINSFHEYGDLYLAIDGYFGGNESYFPELGENGWPSSGPALGWNPNVDWPVEIIPDNILNWTIINGTWAYILVDSNITTSLEKDTQVWARCAHGFAEYHVKTSSRIELSLTFMAIVIVCNFVKLFTMLWVVFMENLDYIVTVGDGAASFLAYPDSTTRGMCVSTKHEVIAKVGAVTDTKEDQDLLAILVRKCGNLWAKRRSQYSTALDRDRVYTSYAM